MGCGSCCDQIRPLTLPEYSMFDRMAAEILLSRCRGDEVWSLEHAKKMGVPDHWLDELQDCFESGFDHDRNTLYTDRGQVNQYHGVRDLDVAYRAAEFLGIPTAEIRRQPLSRHGQVAALQAEADEL